MMGDWPWQAYLAVAGLALTNLALLVRGIFTLSSKAGDSSFRMHERGWDRVSELEKEAVLLRIALQRANARSSVRLTISEILLLAMPLPVEARVAAVKQAREIAENSLTTSQPGRSE